MRRHFDTFAPPAYTLGMVLVEGPPPDALFANALAALMNTPVPSHDIARPGDLQPLSIPANNPMDAVCPAGSQAFEEDCPTCSSSSILCRQPGTPSTNDVPYYPPGGKVGAGFWSQAVAHAAASWYQHGKSNINDAAANPVVLQPFLDHANAWFWGTRPYRLGGGTLADSLGGGSTAQAIPWNDVPWGIISSRAWAWLTAHEADIDWPSVRAFLLANAPSAPPNVDAPDVDWMEAVSAEKGFNEAPAAWANNERVKEIPWAMKSWPDIPWQDVPWGAIDWDNVTSPAYPPNPTDDLKGALLPFKASPTTEYAKCEDYCAQVAPNDPACLDACKAAHPGADTSVKPCPDGSTMRSDGSCAKEPPPPGSGGLGFQNVNPIINTKGPKPNAPAVIDPATGCPLGQIKTNGVCGSPSDTGLTGGQVIAGLAGLSLLALAVRAATK